MAEPCGRRACTCGELGVEAIIFDASAAGTTVSGAWTMTGSGDGGATLDPGPLGFPIIRVCRGRHRVLEPKPPVLLHPPLDDTARQPLPAAPSMGMRGVPRMAE